MRLSPPCKHPYRKPDNYDQDFEEGEFTEFIKPLQDTLDLYHQSDTDPRLALTAFEKLQADNPEDDLELVSVEKKGKNRDKLLLRATTSEKANLSQLSGEYFNTLDYYQSLPPEAKEALFIQNTIIINKLLEGKNQPSPININNQNQDNTMTNESREIKTENYYEQSGNFGIGNMSGGTINEGVKVADIINEATSKNLAESAQEIQQLLAILEQSYPPEISTDDQEELEFAVKKINKDIQLKEKFIKALKAGSKEALKELVKNPYINIVMATVEGWNND